MHIILCAAVSVLLLIAAVAGNRFIRSDSESDAALSAAEETTAVMADEEEENHVTHKPVTILETMIIDDIDDNTPNNKGYAESFREKQIYSYTQAPTDYYDGDPKWVGDWAHIMAGGQEFIYFGCGICCLSNIVSTFRAQDIEPDVVYYLAKEKVDYRPESGIGAMSWGQLKKMCEIFGMTAELKNKPADYSEFQKDIYESEAAIVLVSKANDDKLWYYTNGHYVNVWEYDPETDTVFLSDASTLYNRDRVALRDIYNALKTSSNAQYMTVFPG